MNIAIIISIILAGFTAITSQIVLMRELLVVFYGNELSIAFILAAWLAGGGAGGVILGSLSDRIDNKIPVFCACQIAVSIMLPVSIMVIRSIRPILGINPGEIIPIFTIAVSSLLIMLPICTTLGFMFALSSSIYKPEPKLGASKIGEVYVLEALGAMVGGIVTGFVLIRYLGAMQIMGLVSTVTAAVSIILYKSSKTDVAHGPAKYAPVFAVSLCVILWLTGAWGAIDRHFLNMEWPLGQLLASENSNYGNIVVTRKNGQFTFFDNGLRLYSVPDRPAAEEAVHFAMLEHPDPKKVLIVGGGAGGLISEISRHHVDRIDYVELDPLIIRMANKFLPSDLWIHISGGNVRVINEDGRKYIKSTSEKYDVIIINIGDPYTAQLNRFYTIEFFKEAGSVMNPGAIISFGLSASESYIGEEVADLLRSVYATLDKVFPDVKVIPGETAYFIASNNKGLLTYDYQALMRRARQRSLDLTYVREYYLSDRMSKELIGYTEKTVKGNGKIRINRDFKPASYYYGIIAWAKRFKDSSLVAALKSVNERLVLTILTVIYVSVLLFGFIQMARRRLFKDAAMLSVTINGHSQMAFQVTILIAFQMLYGYMFYKLGIILAAFMAGAGFGALVAAKVSSRVDNRINRLVLLGLQGCLSVYPLALIGVLNYLSVWRGDMVVWIGPNVIFLGLPLLSGFIGGSIFSTASALTISHERARGSAAGINYGLDLLGSCAGAILTGVFMIPILGIQNTCFAISALNFKVLAVLIAGVVFI